MSPQIAAFLALLRRFPLAATCIVITLLCGGAAWWLSEDIDDQELARADRAKEGEAMLDLLVGGSTQRQELAAAREAARRIDDNLVLDDLANNSWYFYRIEEQTKSHLVEFHPQSSPPGSDTSLYKRVPFTLKVTGSFEQVAGFLLALETGPRLANITAFTFTRRDKDNTALSLDLSVEQLGKK